MKSKATEREFHGVRLKEGKRIMWLRVNIDTYNIKASLVQAHARAARAAKQVQSLQFGSHQRAFMSCTPFVAGFLGDARLCHEWSRITSTSRVRLRTLAALALVSRSKIEGVLPVYLSRTALMTTGLLMRLFVVFAASVNIASVISTLVSSSSSGT